MRICGSKPVVYPASGARRLSSRLASRLSSSGKALDDLRPAEAPNVVWSECLGDGCGQTQARVSREMDQTGICERYVCSVNKKTAL